MSSDMLVKLYELTHNPEVDARMARQGLVVRRALPPEMATITAWIRPRFGEGWVSEATVAICRQPPACFIAVEGQTLVGFACYDATARGFFGPTGVDTSMRGRGAGHALLLACLHDMRAQGYGYAIIGGAGPTEFYARSVGATVITGSSPGLYRGMLPAAQPSEISN